VVLRGLCHPGIEVLYRQCEPVKAHDALVWELDLQTIYDDRSYLLRVRDVGATNQAEEDAWQKNDEHCASLLL